MLQDALYARCTILFVLALCFDSPRLAFSSEPARFYSAAATDPEPALRSRYVPGALHGGVYGGALDDAAATDGVVDAADEEEGKDPAAATIEQFFSERTTAFSVTDRDEPRETTTSTASSPARTAQDSHRPPLSPFGSFAHVIGPSTERMVRLTNANNEFAFRLAKALIKSSPQRNIFFSPLTLFRFVHTRH